MSKRRLLVDMDGTLAKFHDEVSYLERMFEKDFFRNLQPFYNMIEGIRIFMKDHPDVEVFIVSARVNGEPPYCEEEKNAWLDEYLPEIDCKHRIFTEMGRSKAEYMDGPVTENDYLLDDYNKGLKLFQQDGGSAIKCHNNINQRGLGMYGGSKGNMWLGPMVHTEDKPELIAAELASHMGLSYDLNKVKAAYDDIGWLGEDPNIYHKYLFRTDDGNYRTVIRSQTAKNHDFQDFENGFNALRYLHGDNNYREFTLYCPDGKSFTATALEINTLCKNIESEYNIDSMKASAIFHIMNISPELRSAEIEKVLKTLWKKYDIENRVKPFFERFAERKRNLNEMITSASDRKSVSFSNAVLNELIR